MGNIYILGSYPLTMVLPLWLHSEITSAFVRHFIFILVDELTVEVLVLLFFRKGEYPTG